MKSEKPPVSLDGDSAPSAPADGPHPPPARLDELETIYRTAPIGLAVLDRDLRFVRINDRLAEINGASVEAHIGRAVREIVPDLGDQAEAALRRVLETGEPLRDIEFVGETPARPGVQGIWREQWHPVRDEQGEVIGISVVAEDVTEQRRTEQALRDSEARLRRTVHNVPFPLMLHAEDGEVLELSQVWTTLTGYAREELPTHHDWFRLAYAPRHAEQASARIVKEFAEERGMSSGEWVVRAKDGSQRTWDFTSVPLGRLTDGRRLQLSAAVDVTERKAAQAARVRSEEQLATIFQQAPAGLGEIGFDGRFRRVNEALCRFLDRSAEELLALTLSDIGHPEDLPRSAPLLARVIETGEPFTIEQRYRRPDGRDVWGSTSVSRLHDEAGRPAALLAATVDISDRIAAQEQLRENRRRLDAVLNNASVAVFVMDERLQCVYMNPAAEQLTGYGLPEVQGRVLHGVVHHTRPDGRAYPVDQCPIDRALCAGDQQRGEEIFVHKDGSFYPVAYTASPIRDDAGQLIGTILEVRDIRREKETLEAVRDANRAKDEFLAMLGHELRNPLSPIVTSLQLMRMRGLHSREQDIIGRQVQHLVRLVDDLLDVSRVTRGLVELRRAEVEMAEIVARGAEIASTSLEQRGNRLVMNVPPRGLAVDADIGRMAQVLSNLLTNASKFSDSGSRIVLRAWGDAGQVLVSVKDEGIGIGREMLDRVFEPFVQDEQGKDRSLGGLGLGLAIARSLVELHGGRLSAHSEGIGRGSEFVVTLPAARQMATPTADDVPGVRRRPRSTSRRVLLVDDNRDAAETLRSVLQAAGHEVLAVFDAAGALQHAPGFDPEVAVLDIGLPVMDGYELAARLQQMSTHDRCPRLIALTGYGVHSDRLRSAEAGFAVHLVKPVDIDELLDAIG